MISKYFIGVIRVFLHRERERVVVDVGDFLLTHGAQPVSSQFENTAISSVDQGSSHGMVRSFTRS